MILLFLTMYHQYFHTLILQRRSELNAYATISISTVVLLSLRSGSFKIAPYTLRYRNNSQKNDAKELKKLKTTSL